MKPYFRTAVLLLVTVPDIDLVRCQSWDGLVTDPFSPEAWF